MADRLVLPVGISLLALGGLPLFRDDGSDGGDYRYGLAVLGDGDRLAGDTGQADDAAEYGPGVRERDQHLTHCTQCAMCVLREWRSPDDKPAGAPR